MAKGKGKGSEFERWVCKQLSLWRSGGKRTDLFWRTAMSGGRATVARKRGVAVRQGGDICAVAPDGHELTEIWHIECKHYKRIDLGQFIVSNEGKIVGWWKKAQREAKEQGKTPMLIAKQNFWPPLVITPRGMGFKPICRAYRRRCDVSYFSDMVKT